MLRAQLAQDKIVLKLMLKSKLKFSGTQNDSTTKVSHAKAMARASAEAVQGFAIAVLCQHHVLPTLALFKANASYNNTFPLLTRYTGCDTIPVPVSTHV